MRSDFHGVSRIALVFVWIAASAAGAGDPPKRTLRIIEDLPKDTDSAALAEWRSEISAFRKQLRQVEHVENHPDYTFSQFEISKEGDGEWLSLALRARYQTRDESASSEIWPTSKCEQCPLSHVRRLFRATVQTKLFDPENGLYRPYAVGRCMRDAIGNVDIAVQPANGLSLEPEIYYFVGEWIEVKGKPKRLVLSLVSLELETPGVDGVHAKFRVSAPTDDVRNHFRDQDCNGLPPYPIVLVPRLLVPLRAGTRNDKVQ